MPVNNLRRIKFVIEWKEDGYSLGLKGVVIAEDDSKEEALKEARSAGRFHGETFGMGASQ